MINYVYMERGESWCRVFHNRFLAEEYLIDTLVLITDGQKIGKPEVYIYEGEKIQPGESPIDIVNGLKPVKVMIPKKDIFFRYSVIELNIT